MSATGADGNTNPSGVLISAQWEKPVVPDTGGQTTMLVRINAMQALPGQRRAPLDVAFVLDRSGSMQGEKLSLVKEAVSTATALLRDEDRVALVIYDQTVERLQSLTAATSRAKAALRLALHGVDAGGATNLSGGWLAGCDELARSMADDQTGGRIRRSLLLTDGLANEGITGQEELAGHASSLRKLGVSTTTLGVGLDFDEHLLATMAEAGGGNFQYIESASQLPAFFQGELGELLSVVATGLNVSITPPEGVRARLMNAFPAEQTGRKIDVAVGEVPAGTEINLVFELTVGPGSIGAAHQLMVEASWTEPAIDKAGRFRQAMPALRIVSSEEAEGTAANDEVREAAALQRADAAQREAMRLDREGRHVESRVHLRQQAALLAAAPQSSRVVKSFAFMGKLAETDASVGYTSNVRKQVTFDAHRRSRGKQSDSDQ